MLVVLFGRTYHMVVVLVSADMKQIEYCHEGWPSPRVQYTSPEVRQMMEIIS